MKIDDFFLPSSDEWMPKLNWQVVENLPEYQKMKGCKQHTFWHKEGDVMTHTNKSVEALYDLFRNNPYLRLSKELVLATLLHDVGKPDTTKLNNEGEYSAKNHGPVGARITRGILSDEPDLMRREHVCSLVRDHMILHHIFDDDSKLKRNVLRLNHTYAPSTEYLYLNYADDFGSENEQTTEVRLNRLRKISALFDKNKIYKVLKYKSNIGKLCDSYGSENNEKSPHDMFGVVIMVGYPGSGKDYFIEHELKNVPVVSRDAVRIELGLMTPDKKGVGSKEDEEKVTEVCDNLIEKYCKERKSFVINNTSLPMYRRKEIIEKLLPYSPFITIVFIDTPIEICKERRKDEIPDYVYDRMSKSFDFPMPYEANRIIRVTSDGKKEILWDDSNYMGGTLNCDWTVPFRRWSLFGYIKKKIINVVKFLRKYLAI